MKKTLFMLTFLSMLACQKKQYATFQKSNIAIFDKKKTLTLANLSTIKRQDSTVLGEIYKTAYPTKLTFTAVHFNSRREVASTHKAKATTKDAIFADGLKVEKQKKQLRKKPSDPTAWQKLL